MDTVRDAVVALIWTDTNKPDVYTRTTGFIYKRNGEGLFILSTSQQVLPLFKDQTKVPKSQIRVEVEFLNGLKMDAYVLHLDIVLDLTLIIVKSCDQLNTHPIDCIKPISFSLNPPSRGHSVYTYHHPEMVDIATCAKLMVFDQYTDGFIVDDSRLNSGIVTYHMPLIFPGSSGAPVVNLKTNKLVSMIAGYISYHNVSKKGAHADTNWGEVHDLRGGPTVATIQYFLNKAETANTSTSTNPTTEADQAGQTGTDSDMVDLTIV